MLELIIKPIIAGLADWIRGGKWSPQFRAFTAFIFTRLTGGWITTGISPGKPAMMIVGFLYVDAIAWTWWGLIPIIWLPLFSQIMGTGNPMGKLVLGHERWEKMQMREHGYTTREQAELHGWEKYQYTDNAWLTIAWLGCIWSFGFVIVALITANPWYVVPCLAYTVSMPLSGVIARKIFDDDDQINDRWPAMEGIRSYLAMLLTLLVVAQQ